MADVINFLFFNVELFPLYEVIICLLIYVLIYIIFCAFRKYFTKRLKDGRFSSTARQFGYQRSPDAPATEATPPEATPPFGESVLYRNPLNVQPSTSSSTTALTAASSHPPTAEAVTWWTSCSECSHPRERLRRLPRHLLFAFISYFLCVVVFIIFALSIETVIVIDPHSCLGGANGTEEHLIGGGSIISGEFNGSLDAEGFDRAWYCNYTFQVPHEEVWLKGNGDADIHGWWVQGDTTRHDTYKATREAPGGKTFFIAHGRSLPIPVYKKWIQQLVEMGHSVFIFDYRDFGKSTGVPTESNMNADAEMALNYVAKRQNISKWEVVPMGISLGGSIATNLAVKHNSTALALISSVDSIREEIKANLKLTGWAVASAMHYKFDTVAAISRFEGCLFFYIGGMDDIIPAWRGRRLFDKTNKKTAKCSFLAEDPKAGHCGEPGTALDNPKIDRVFREWANSYEI